MQIPLSSTITLGETTGYYRPRAFGILRNDRRFHMFAIGQTGTGKTTLLRNLMLQDIQMGQGFMLLDPHGDLALSLKDHLDKRAIYWDTGDNDCPYGYNPLTYVSVSYRPLIASGLIDALKKQWSDAWGARMEHLLRFALLALLEQPYASMVDIMPLFIDKQFRLKIIAGVKNQAVLDFWKREYPAMNYKGSVDGVAPIANKLGGFLSHPNARKMLCDPEKPLRLRTIMDDGITVVINLSKGRVGSDISNILGGLIVSSLTNAAYSRQTIPEDQRRLYMLYGDEFHSFTSSTFAEMLSEIRKYGLAAILASQTTAQIEKQVMESIFGNVGTLMAFRVGANDAPLITKQFGHEYPRPRDLVNQPNFEMFIKMMVAGAQTRVFSARTLSNR